MNLIGIWIATPSRPFQLLLVGLHHNSYQFQCRGLGLRQMFRRALPARCSGAEILTTAASRHLERTTVHFRREEHEDRRDRARQIAVRHGSAQWKPAADLRGLLKCGVASSARLMLLAQCKFRDSWRSTENISSVPVD
jgi:hypothetical protein